ncbi:g163 [Coccomyxa viridis]|uniref:G163 protein n=1 Tax=Coccomyxa viridis TaxID=1274662 RepID=A0ABP1FLQ7_9CHLO
MGAGWRRVSEGVKQSWHLTEKNFLPTSNARNTSMLREAATFADHLKHCEKDIRNLKNSSEAMLTTTKTVLSAPLPRVYEESANGKAVPVSTPAPGPIGGGFQQEDLGRISKETSKKLEAEVLAPMNRWTTAFSTVETRMKKLEQVRLEVDSRRHTVSQLAQKIEKQRNKLTAAGDRQKGEDNLEATIRRMQHKENKLAASRQSFKEQEALVYQQLAQLIRDGVWLKSYLAAVMRLQQEAYLVAYNALSAGVKTQLPLPPMSPDNALPAPSEPAAIPANRPFDPAQVLNKRPPGKENGIGGYTAKEELPSAPPPNMPTMPAHRRTESRGYDRYAEPAY